MDFLVSEKLRRRKKKKKITLAKKATKYLHLNVKHDRCVNDIHSTYEKF